MKALIKVGYGCNQSCAFCHAEGRRAIDAASDEIEGRIERAARLGHTMVVFSGGEPTLRRELPDWAARVAALGMDLGLVTNGAGLDAARVGPLLGRRLRYAHLSLHGGAAAVHDALVGARAFERALGALRALSGHGLDLWVNCVVTARNLGALRGVVDVVRAFPDAGLKFSFVEPRGGAEERFEELVPAVTDAARAVEDALAYAASTPTPLRVAHDFLPLCLLPGREGVRGDLRAQGFWTMAEVGERDLFPVDERNLVRPERCRPCALRGRCPGLFVGYHRRRGDGELRPVVGGTRSNSFHWTLEGGVRAPVGGGCPVLALGVDPWDPVRHLFVRNGSRIARFRTDSRDFCDEDLGDVKHRAGQIYYDASRVPAPDDFARQLVKLRRAGDCAPCPERTRCTGLFEPVAENLFDRDNARVLELLGALEGDVLDVGCGEGPYGDALAARASAGHIRYVGVEPDPARAAGMRARWPWAAVRACAAEALEVGASTLDHVLILRSWNHLRDPAAVLRALAAGLRVGGTLTLVDNEPFGLARTRRDAARAERSAAGFEHWRNDRAEDAHRWVEGAGLLADLELVERRDVSPETSNQWLLRYRRRGGAPGG